VTTWQEDLQQGLAAAFAAWGGLVDATTKASVGMWASMVQWAGDERSEAPPNSSAVLVHSDAQTAVHARVHRADDVEQVPVAAGLVSVDPPVLPAMAPGRCMKVVVRVDPGPPPTDGQPSPMRDAGYLATLYDDRGAPLSPVPVYVALHLPWSS
jgi:hypothetical protein